MATGIAFVYTDVYPYLKYAWIASLDGQERKRILYAFPTNAFDGKLALCMTERSFLNCDVCELSENVAVWGKGSGCAYA